MKIAVAVVLSVCVSVTAVFADAGLDGVVMLDRSASMRHQERTGTLLLSMLLDVVARNAASTHLDHRIAVVSFGSSAHVDVPFSSVNAATLPRLRSVVERLPAQARGDTDFVRAFGAVEALFRELPADAARRRAIVLVTDGVPFVRNVEPAAYERELRRAVAAQRTRSNASLQVLLIGGTARAATLWRELADGLQLTDAQPDLVLAVAHGIVTQLVGTRTVESAPAKNDDRVDTLILPPYLDVVVFDVFRAAAEATVDVVPPGEATPLRAGVAGVETMNLGGVMTTLVVPRPAPGRWTIRKSHAAARVRIVSQQFFPRGALLSPHAGDRLRQFDRVALAYGLSDSNGRPFVELPAYTLSLELSMTMPNGSVAGVAMERASRQTSLVFRAPIETEFALPGRYWTDARLTVVDDEGRRLDVFRDRWSGFTVMSAPRSVARAGIHGSRIAWSCVCAAGICALLAISLRRRSTKPSRTVSFSLRE